MVGMCVVLAGVLGCPVGGNETINDNPVEIVDDEPGDNGNGNGNFSDRFPGELENINENPEVIEIDP